MLWPRRDITDAPRITTQGAIADTEKRTAAQPGGGGQGKKATSSRWLFFHPRNPGNMTALADLVGLYGGSSPRPPRGQYPAPTCGAV